MKTQAFLTGDRARDQRNVDLLLGAVGELYGSADLGAIVRSAVDRSIEVTGAQRGVLLLAEADGRLAVRLARHRDGRDLPPDLRYSRSVVQRVWTTGKPHLTVDVEGREGLQAGLGGSILDIRLLSILALPLVVKDRRIGVLYVDSTAQAKEFTEGDRAVFEALAGLVSVAIEQARLAAEERERKRLSGEMDAARRIQQSLMPRGLSAPAGFDLAAEGWPCEETSGDYYDVVPLGDGRIALVVGDVSNHGLGPALFMTSARAVLRTLLGTTRDAVAAFEGLNAFLCRDMPEDSFMSLFVGVLDPADASLRWVNAGHNAPLLWQPGHDLVELGRTGPILRAVEGYSYRAAGPSTLAPGAAVVLYTDGLFESRGPDGEPWGEERLASSVVARAHADGTAASVLEGVLGDLKAYVGPRRLDDDVTCMVLRRLAAPEGSR